MATGYFRLELREGQEVEETLEVSGHLGERPVRKRVRSDTCDAGHRGKRKTRRQ